LRDPVAAQDPAEGRRVGAAEDGDLVTQRKQLDVLGRRAAPKQQGQTKHLHKDQIQ
jgi:hypothetical protein